MNFAGNGVSGAWIIKTNLFSRNKNWFKGQETKNACIPCLTTSQLFTSSRINLINLFRILFKAFTLHLHTEKSRRVGRLEEFRCVKMSASKLSEMEALSATKVEIFVRSKNIASWQ